VAQNRQEAFQAFVLAGQHRDPALQHGDPLERITHPIRVGGLAVVPGFVHVKNIEHAAFKTIDHPQNNIVSVIIR
jgi:hypothetical protein